MSFLTVLTDQLMIALFVASVTKSATLPLIINSLR